MPNGRVTGIFILSLAYVLALSVPVCATTFHVSPFGSNTPPFGSYADAAIDPLDAFGLATGAGDTVLFHAGTYDLDSSTAHVARGVTVIGILQDSVNILMHPVRDFHMLFQIYGDNEVAGIHFGLSSTRRFNESIAIFRGIEDGYCTIHDCTFSGVQIAPSSGGPTEVFDNVFRLTGTTGCLSYGSDGGEFRIHHNVFYGGSGSRAASAIGVEALGSARLLVEHNVFDFSEAGTGAWPISLDDHFRPVAVRNNLFIGGGASIIWFQTSGAFENNTVIGPNSKSLYQGIGFYIESGQTLSIRNNAFVDLGVRINFGNGCGQSCPTSGPIALAYNAYWPSVDSFYSIIDPGRVRLGDTANIAGYPMFVDDSLYELQLGSPLIDAGDPAILDPDGSRSDIGWTGGPGGIVYEYVDLPPLLPESLTATGRDTIIVLRWSARPETDLAGYRVYRGYQPDFWMPGLPPAFQVPSDTTQRLEHLARDHDSIYHVVTSIDLAGQESAPSPEAEYIISAHPLGAAPEWIPVAPLTVEATDSLVFQVRALDADGDSLSLWSLDMVENLAFIDLGGGIGEIRFGPQATQVGEYVVAVEASDGFLSDTVRISITVVDHGMNPPIWQEIPAQSVIEGDTLNVHVAASDSDGDFIVLTAGNLPPYASFVDSTNGRGSLTFMPDTTQAGNYQVELVAWDGELADTIVVHITVSDRVDGPVSPGILMVYPNPMSTQATVKLSIPGGGGETNEIKLVLHDLLGRTIATCFEGPVSGGVQEVEVDLTETGIGIGLVSGVYFMRMESGARTVGKLAKIAILK